MSTFRTRLLKHLSPVLRSKFGRRLIVWMILNMHSLLPMKPLFETNDMLAYFHPQPAYPFHVILFPKNKIPDMLTLDISKDAGFLQDVIQISQKIVKEYQLEKVGYRLILNGGSNQDFPILHFHLIAEETPTQAKDPNG